jgi:hypothetical protein
MLLAWDLNVKSLSTVIINKQMYLFFTWDMIAPPVMSHYTKLKLWKRNNNEIVKLKFTDVIERKSGIQY